VSSTRDASSLSSSSRRLGLACPASGSLAGAVGPSALLLLVRSGRRRGFRPSHTMQSERPIDCRAAITLGRRFPGVSGRSGTVLDPWARSTTTWRRVMQRPRSATARRSSTTACTGAASAAQSTLRASELSALRSTVTRCRILPGSPASPASSFFSGSIVGRSTTLRSSRPSSRTMCSRTSCGC
jgi:hypothetical protein